MEEHPVAGWKVLHPDYFDDLPDVDLYDYLRDTQVSLTGDLLRLARKFDDNNDPETANKWREEGLHASWRVEELLGAPRTKIIDTILALHRRQGVIKTKFNAR